MRQLFVGLIAEGNTDVRFLKKVVYKSVLDISWECDNEVEVFDIRDIEAEGDTFVRKVLDGAYKASTVLGISMICVHSDSDHKTAETVIQNKFEPLFQELEKVNDIDYCKHIVPTIPIQMIESWMLADKGLLKQLINANDLRDADLGLERAPESYADPKAAIENAIRLAMERQPKKKRDQIHISDLYELLGTRLSLEKLRTISSFCHFEGEVRRVFRDMGLIR